MELDSERSESLGMELESKVGEGSEEREGFGREREEERGDINIISIFFNLFM